MRDVEYEDASNDDDTTDDDDPSDRRGPSSDKVTFNYKWDTSDTEDDETPEQWAERSKKKVMIFKINLESRRKARI